MRREHLDHDDSEACSLPATALIFGASPVIRLKELVVLCVEKYLLQ